MAPPLPRCLTLPESGLFYSSVNSEGLCLLSWLMRLSHLYKGTSENLQKKWNSKISWFRGKTFWNASIIFFIECICHELFGGSVRLHRWGAQSLKTARALMAWPPTPGCYPCADQSAESPSVGSMLLLEQLPELGETEVLTEEMGEEMYVSRKVGRGVDHLCLLRARHPPGTPHVQPSRCSEDIWGLWGVPLHKNLWLDHCPMLTTSTFSPSPSPGGWAMDLQGPTLQWWLGFSSGQSPSWSH